MTSGHPLPRVSKAAALEALQDGFCKEFVFTPFLFCPIQSATRF